MPVNTPMPSTDTAFRAAGAPDLVKVLYIGGQGRSGSTLLGRLLGEVPGFVNVGELRMIWLAMSENRLCGCGTPIQECEFWTRVAQHGFGGWSGINALTVLQTKRAMERLRSAPRLLSPLKSRAQSAMLTKYGCILETLYAAIRTVSGSHVIVDGSKTPMYAYTLQGVDTLDLRLVHLVRDSRAVAYSWQRKKLNPGIHWKESYFQPVAPARVAMEWAAKNLLTDILTPRRVPSMFLRYEEAVLDPPATIERLAQFMGEAIGPGALDFLLESPISLGAHHTVTGNPDRFKSTLTIRPDAEWRDRMNRGQLALVTLLTYPLLARYGYMKGR